MDFYTKFIKLLIKNDLDKMKEMNIKDIEERAMNLIIKVADQIEKKQNSKERYCFCTDYTTDYLIPLELREEFYKRRDNNEDIFSMYRDYITNTNTYDYSFINPKKI